MIESYRSKLAKEQHSRAKIKKSLYQQYYADEETPKYSEFMKKKSPLDDRLVKYTVSFEVDYESRKNKFKVSTVNFTVIAIRGQENINSIYSNTREAFINSIGTKTSGGFSSGFKATLLSDYSEPKIKIDVTEEKYEPSTTEEYDMRGLEKVDVTEKDISRENLYNNLLVNKGVFVVDKELRFNISNKSSKSTTKINLRDYF